MNDSTEYVFGATNALRIEAIRVPGQLETERVLLRVVQDCNLVQFALLNAESAGEGHIRDLNRGGFWFPEWAVREGDWVRVYTRIGTANRHRAANGSIWHNFFWNQTKPIWTGRSNAAVLLEVAAWSMMRLSEE